MEIKLLLKFKYEYICFNEREREINKANMKNSNNFELKKNVMKNDKCTAVY